MARARRDLAELLAVVSEQTALLRRMAVGSPADAATVEALAARAAGVVERGHLAQLIERPKVGVSIALTCSAHPGRTLAGARAGSHGAGRYATPGGHVEYDQPFEEAAVRELEEEAGIVLPTSRTSYVGMTSDVMPDDHLHYLTFWLTADITPEEASLIVNAEPEKCAGWEWLTWAELGGDSSRPAFVPLRNFVASGMHARLPAHGATVTAAAAPPTGSATAAAAAAAAGGAGR